MRITISTKITLMILFAMVAILFFAPVQAISAYAADASEAGIVTEYSAFGKASIEDDFADDRILVVLNRQETLRFKGWGVQDFPEIGIVSVEI